MTQTQEKAVKRNWLWDGPDVGTGGKIFLITYNYVQVFKGKYDHNEQIDEESQ